MVNWATNFNMFGMYKRMWYPNHRIQFKVDDDRICIHEDCALITFIPVGIGLRGITGDMDDAIAVQGLENVIGADLPKLMQHAKSISPPMREHITEAAFLTAFTKTADIDGQIVYQLQGVVHTDSRLIPAITQI